MLVYLSLSVNTLPLCGLCSLSTFSRSDTKSYAIRLTDKCPGGWVAGKNNENIECTCDWHLLTWKPPPFSSLSAEVAFRLLVLQESFEAKTKPNINSVNWGCNAKDREWWQTGYELPWPPALVSGESRNGNRCNKIGESTSEGQVNTRVSDTSPGKYYNLPSILDCTYHMYAGVTCIIVSCEINGNIKNL